MTNNPIYNLIKKLYYKHLAFKNVKHRWDVKHKLVKIYFGKEEYFFKIFEEKTENYTKPAYLCENIPFFCNELQGYLKEIELKDGDIILDCGAFEGAFSIFCSKKIGMNGKIISFEPEFKNFEIIKENIILNKCTNIVPRNLGVWNKKKNLYFEGSGIGGHISKNGKVKIKVTDLDSELKRLKIPFEKVSFVKMDIEGAEIEAIDGMKELLAKGSPQLAIASYHIREGKKTYIEVEKKLKQRGYHVKTGYPRHLTTWAKKY